MPTANATVSEEASQFPCPLCGQPLTPGAVECTKCDWVQGYRHRVPITAGSSRDFAAAALSIIPGLGHLFKGHVKPGIGFMIGSLVIVFFIGAAGMVAMGFQLLLLPLYWIGVMVLAFMTPDLKVPAASCPPHMA